MRPLGEDDVAAGVLPRLEHVVSARPEHVAVDDGRTTLTFAELVARAAQVRVDLERHLGSATAATDTTTTRPPVAVLGAHDAASVVAIVATLSTGHPVVVLDDRTPVPWQRRLLARLGASAVVTDAARPGSLETATAIVGPDGVVATGTDEADPALLWRDPPPAEAPAVVAFTSGTTGASKPVVGSHRLLVRDAWNSAVASCCYDETDIVLHTLPLPFHAGLTTAVHTLLVGCGMRLFDVRSLGVATLPRAVADSGGTLLVTSPAILRGLAASDPDRDLLTSLSGLTVAGESVYGRDVEAARELVGSHCVVRNRYGASEVGLIAEHVVTDFPSGRLPVGRAVGWNRVDVVREDGRSADVDEKGTIVVTAPDVALGYLGRDDDPAFVDNRDGTRTFRTSDLGRRLRDGTIDLTGRSDHAVSVRGYLVDPGEVEAVALALPGVRECVVTGHESPSGTRLLAYVVGEAASDPAAVRARLREHLPGHMVPAEVVALSALPRTDRGKIDRRALPLPASGDRGHEPLTHWEQLVADAWTLVLDVVDLRPDDDFFALGGDSLAAEELMTRLRDDLGVPGEQASSSTIAQAPTLREFAAAVEPRHRGGGGRVPLHAAGTRPPLFVTAGAGGLGRTLGSLARRLGADQPVHALQSPSLEGRALPDVSITATARRHLAAAREVTTGPLFLAGHGFGGLVALEMARLAEEAGQTVPFVALLDTTPPSHVRPDSRPRWRRVKADLGLLQASLRDTTGGTEAWRWQLKADALAAAYVPAPRRGRTLVLTASDGPGAAGQEAWAQILTGATHRHVPGGPLTMLRPPNVDAVASHLRTAIDDALAAVDTHPTGGESRA
ncbi:putative non-ribosomal peptide synthetase [Mobilicoccus pelagius NBRC 104925]|uniref:Putative non-ribosomal peptide synthetase n=1 Tax=Mobilicoccus pelagius NBRC 104925 TaxID=1089455 RepID=H5UR80_9MICO|nr:putative non-ribosomal peptide synthetase [Mobilicoccus pelagius NBRC 104925]